MNKNCHSPSIFWLLFLPFVCFSLLCHLLYPLIDISRLLSQPIDRMHFHETEVIQEINRMLLTLGINQSHFSKNSFAILNDDDDNLLSDLPHFYPMLTPTEVGMSRYLLEIFSSACRWYNIEYFLVDDSLLGSTRHHGLIPWKLAEVTVAMAQERKSLLLSSFEGIHNMILMWPDPNVWTLRLTVLPKHTNIRLMPCIFIMFYVCNTTHLWFLEHPRSGSNVIHHSDVFPLTLRPFEGQMQPAPCNITALLEAQQLNVNICRIVSKNQIERTFDCDEFKKVFPFVNKSTSTSDGNTIDTLIVSDVELYKRKVKSCHTHHINNGVS